MAGTENCSIHEVLPLSQRTDLDKLNRQKKTKLFYNYEMSNNLITITYMIKQGKFLQHSYPYSARSVPLEWLGDNKE